MSARVSAVLYGKESIRLLFRENDLAQVILHLATEKGNWLQCCFPGNNIIYRRQIHSAGITFLFGMHARAPPIIEYVLHNRIWMRRQSTWLSLNSSLFQYRGLTTIFIPKNVAQCFLFPIKFPLFGQYQCGTCCIIYWHQMLDMAIDPQTWLIYCQSRFIC